MQFFSSKPYLVTPTGHMELCRHSEIDMDVLITLPDAEEPVIYIQVHSCGYYQAFSYNTPLDLVAHVLPDIAIICRRGMQDAAQKMKEAMIESKYQHVDN
jgi:hypothetical protein